MMIYSCSYVHIPSQEVFQYQEQNQYRKMVLTERQTSPKTMQDSEW